jgi:hypothetical protein
VSGPSSAKGWFLWSCYVLESQSRPFSPQLDRIPGTDPRLRDSRESALSVKILAERASKKCSANGDGYELLMDFYVREASWWSFTDAEQRIIAKTARAFAKALREAGFTPDGNP